MSRCALHLDCDGGRPCDQAQAALRDIASWTVDPSHVNRKFGNDVGSGGQVAVSPFGKARHRKPMHAFTHGGAKLRAEMRATPRGT